MSVLNSGVLSKIEKNTNGVIYEMNNTVSIATDETWESDMIHLYSNTFVYEFQMQDTEYEVYADFYHKTYGVVKTIRLDEGEGVDYKNSRQLKGQIYYPTTSKMKLRFVNKRTTARNLLSVVIITDDLKLVTDDLKLVKRELSRPKQNIIVRRNITIPIGEEIRDVAIIGTEEQNRYARGVYLEMSDFSMFYVSVYSPNSDINKYVLKCEMYASNKTDSADEGFYNGFVEGSQYRRTLGTEDIKIDTTNLDHSKFMNTGWLELLGTAMRVRIENKDDKELGLVLTIVGIR